MDLKQPLKKCELIQYLNLEGCELIADKRLLPVVQSNTNLTVLNLSRCCKITDSGMISLSTNCKKLQ